MNINFNGKAEDISMLLVSAERYALGRRTYIVSWVCENIINNLHLLTENDKQVIMHDILEQEKYSYGNECDKQEWLRLLAILEREVGRDENRN